MKTRKISNFAKALHAAAWLSLIAAMSAHAAPAATPQSSGKGSISAVKTHSQDGQLTVSGTARRHAPSHHASGAHVEVQLLDPKGRVIARQTDRIAPVSPKRDSKQRITAFHAKFPNSVASKASSVRVVYHGEPHKA